MLQLQVYYKVTHSLRKLVFPEFFLIYQGELQRQKQTKNDQKHQKYENQLIHVIIM